jgi:hypothetical protein
MSNITGAVTTGSSFAGDTIRAFGQHTLEALVKIKEIAFYIFGQLVTYAKIGASLLAEGFTKCYSFLSAHLANFLKVAGEKLFESGKFIGNKALQGLVIGKDFILSHPEGVAGAGVGAALVLTAVVAVKYFSKA